MPKLNLPKTIAFSLGVLAMIFSLNYLILAWTEPSSTAPNDNVPAPINVGTSTQIKVGALGINGLFTAYSGISVNNKSITDVLSPVNGSDAVNKDYVDALGSEGSSMPLQGQSTIFLSDTRVISTVPISLPKSNCQVKITACGNPPPDKLIIGADPVARITKPVINLGPRGVVPAGPWAGVGYTGVACGNCLRYEPTGWGEGDTPICFACFCPTGYNSCRQYGYGHDCIGYSKQCCPNVSDYLCPINNNVSLYGGSYCMPLDSSYPLFDCIHNYTYKEPRCSTANPLTELFIKYDSPEFICIYCPLDHPQYDSISKNCIKSASVTTTKVGALCSTLNTTLSTAFTDVTFADAASNPLDKEYYVGFAYSCQ